MKATITSNLRTHPGLKFLRSATDNKPTPFQKSVYAAICEIPPGKVTTYKLLALHLHCKSSQAIGQALKRNPFAPDVPCHRVVAHNRKMGGFCGATSGAKIDKKVRMLQEEGVLIREGIVDASCLYHFP